MYLPVLTCTVKPLNKGHFGTNINLLVERLSSSQRFKCIGD